jgi:hypothetical protein
MVKYEDLAAEQVERLKSEIGAKLIELTNIQHDSELVRELSFVAEFQALKEKYGFSSDDAYAMLDPSRLFDRDFSIEEFFNVLQASLVSESPTECRSSSLKRYRNPFTGEVIETKGFNNKKIRAWKSAYGRDAVEAWREL